MTFEIVLSMDIGLYILEYVLRPFLCIGITRALVRSSDQIAIQGTPQMAVDKEAILCLSRVYRLINKCQIIK